jgi:DNA polymerase III subunit delta'
MSDFEILGQEAVLKPMLAAARQGSLSGCYLFEGPDGVGKHEAAVMVALAAACEDDSLSSRPCMECQTCRTMRSGTHPDLVEVGLDPSKRTPTISVAQAREVIRVARLHRYHARHRVFVIDPCDRMVPQAANALLKTLEEPTPGTTFILVTAKVSSLLPTIISRSQRVRFRMVKANLLREWLAGQGYENPERLAALSGGRPARAAELSQGGLDEFDVATAELLDVISAGPTALFKFTEGLSKTGQGRAGWQPVVERYLMVLETLLRDAAVVSMGYSEDVVHERSVVESWAEALWPTGFERIQTELQTTRNRIEANVNARLVMEPLMACVATELGAARQRR